MPKVMISYRNVPAQKKFALELKNLFKLSNVETWIDVEDIKKGQKWKDAIIDGIKDCDYVALCLSEDYFQSDICMMECYIARGYRKKILPIWVTGNPQVDPWQLIPRFVETEGLQYKLIANTDLQDFWGLSLTKPERMRRIVDAVVNPIPHDAVYDVYISYRYHQAPFAAQIAQSLSAKGISTFVMPLCVNVGDDQNEAGWNAILQAKHHIVIMSDDLKDSAYIKNEIRVSQTKDTDFVPVASDNLINQPQKKQAIRQSFIATEFAVLNTVQWFEPDAGYDFMIDELTDLLKNA